MSGDDRTGVDELLADDVYAKVQTFNGAHSQEHEIVRFGENDVIGSSQTNSVHDRVPNITLDVRVICYDESLASLHRDIERFKDFARYPGKLAAGVDHRVR